MLEIAAKAQSKQSGAERIDEHKLGDLARALEAIEGTVDPDTVLPAGFGIHINKFIPQGAG